MLGFEDRGQRSEKFDSDPHFLVVVARGRIPIRWTPMPPQQQLDRGICGVSSYGAFVRLLDIDPQFATGIALIIQIKILIKLTI